MRSAKIYNVRKRMGLTYMEWKVIEAYMKDDFVSDWGWDNLRASTWIVDANGKPAFHRDCGMTAASFSGVMSSLNKKGIMTSNGESMNLTEKGIELVRASLNSH